jgi:hypothetical protein
MSKTEALKKARKMKAEALEIKMEGQSIKNN